jgi:hypothetical protein
MATEHTHEGHTISMREQREHQQRSPAERRERLVGLSAQHHVEDVKFWRQASEHEHGEALYELLRFGEAVRSSITHVREERQRFILRLGEIEIQTIE